MTKKSFLHLLTKELSGNLSPDERRLLDNNLKENKTLGQVHTEFHRYMNSQSDQPTTDVKSKLNEVWERIHSGDYETTTAPARRIVPLWARIAATAAILIGLGTLVYRYLPQQQELYSEVLEAGNENLYTVLDDGTQVWLGKHSQITYNKAFGEESRAIRLTGEAFFDVAYRPEVPLTVTANEVDVTVKGTAFNVNAADDSEVSVTLVRGLVAVKDNDRLMEEVLLHPNEKIVVQKTAVAAGDNFLITALAPLVNDSILPETRWMDDVLVFRKQRLADLVKLMEGRYGVTIEVNGEPLRQQRFTGSIKNESLEQMLDALKQSYPFSYEVEDNRITIR